MRDRGERASEKGGEKEEGTAMEMEGTGTVVVVRARLRDLERRERVSGPLGHFRGLLRGRG